MTPPEAVSKAIKNGYSKELEEIACQNVEWAFSFAFNVPGANIEKCMKAACKDPQYAYWFLQYTEDQKITNEIILYCANWIVLDNFWITEFLKKESRIHVLDLLKSQPKWKNIITQQIIDEKKIKKYLTMTPFDAYCQARDYQYSEELEDIACLNSHYALLFAIYVKEANIIKCMKASCKDPKWAYGFATQVKNADILYCSKYIIKDETWARRFIIYHKKYTNLLKEQPGWKDLINELMVENILL